MSQHVILTRPEGENETLAARLREAGLTVTVRPLINLSAIDTTAAMRSVVMNLDRYDRVIFVSKAAVRFGMPLFDQYWVDWPLAVTWLSVGEGTAAMLIDWEVNACYPAEAGSEGLLALPELNDVAGRKVLIVRGSGGRELLAQTLRQRGAEVDYLEAYTRLPLKYEDWEVSMPVAVLATSIEIMENLVSQATGNLAGIDLIAASARIAEAAAAYPFRSVTNAGGAYEQALYDAVLGL